MSASQRIGRRGFIVTAVGLTATALTARFAFDRESVPDSVASDAERLVSTFSSPESAAEVGRAYLETLAPDPSPRVLVERIVAGLPGGYTAVRRGDEAQLRTLLAHELKEDFRDGNIVMVDGWILSTTEARLCALAALVDSSS